MPASAFSQAPSPCPRTAAEHDSGADSLCAPTSNRITSATPPRRKTDVALQEQAAIVEFTPDALMVISLTGILRTWNPGASRLFGYSASEAIGRPVSMLTGSGQLEEQEFLLQRARSGGAVGPIETLRRRRDGTMVSVELTTMPMRDAGGHVIAFIGTARDISARKMADARCALVADELHHRVKNALATVQAMMIQTLSSATSLAAFGAAFAARLASLSSTHDLLARNAGEGAALSDIIAAELAPYSHAGAARWETSATGPVNLDSRRALSFSMMLHELATNAAKYGAFSKPEGRVKVSWQMRDVEGLRRLNLDWSESGGPAVAAPTRVGFGTRLLTGGLALELNGDVKVHYHPAGLQCAVDVPLDA